MPDEKDKSAPTARQPEVHYAEAKFEGKGELTAKKVRQRGMRMAWRMVWVDEVGGRPSSSELVRGEAQRSLDAGEVPSNSFQGIRQRPCGVACRQPLGCAADERGAASRSACAICGAQPAAAGG